MLFPRKQHQKLIALAKEQIAKQSGEEKTGEEKFRDALEGLVTAADDAIEYPDSWGIAGRALEAVDGPVIRFLSGALLQAVFDGERAAGRV